MKSYKEIAKDIYEECSGFAEAGCYSNKIDGFKINIGVCNEDIDSETGTSIDVLILDDFDTEIISVSFESFCEFKSWLYSDFIKIFE